MEIGIAKRSIDHHQSLGVMANIKLIRHPHTTVDLDGFAKHMLSVSVDLHFQRVYRLSRHRGFLLVFTQRFKQQRLALLISHHGVDHTML